MARLNTTHVLIAACAALVVGAAPQASFAEAADTGRLEVAQRPASGPTSGPASAPANRPYHDGKKMNRQQMMAFHSLSHAMAILQPTAGNTANGTVHFVAMGDHVQVIADVSGLEPNSTHGIHIHEFGDCSAPNGKSAGGHYNPEGKAHGLPPNPARHAGDMGSLKADANGNAHYEVMLKNVSIAGMWNPIIGRGVIVHAKPDDGGQPTGNAGARLACGVIGIAKAQ